MKYVSLLGLLLFVGCGSSGPPMVEYQSGGIKYQVPEAISSDLQRIDTVVDRNQ